MEQWSAGRFFWNNDLYLTTIRAFCQKFVLNFHDLMPSRNPINLWVKNFWKTASASKKPLRVMQRASELPRILPEYEKLSSPVPPSPTWLVVKQASALGLSRTFFVNDEKWAPQYSGKMAPLATHRRFQTVNTAACIRFMSHFSFCRFWSFGWPPRSPGLSTCDFFLWGYLKSRVLYFQAAYSGRTTGEYSTVCSHFERN